METLWVEEFLHDYIENRRPFMTVEKASKKSMSIEEIAQALAPIEKIYRENISRKSLDEITDIIIYSTIEEYEALRNKYGIPGYTASVQVGNINVGIFGGKTSTSADAINMPENALFDIASMTKLYTQIVAYNLMREGCFKKSDVIKDLDSHFRYLSDVTVGDILSFSVRIETPDRIDTAFTDEEALNRLYDAKVIEKGNYLYTDIGMMVIAQVAKNLTKKSFKELVNHYIVTPLHLKNTFLFVPEDKRHLITGTPNAKTGHVNDMKANMMESGVSGHAGVLSDYDDIMKVLRATRSGIIIPDNHDFITPSQLYAYNKAKDTYTLRDFNAIAGNVYLGHIKGIDKTWVPNFDPRDTIGTSGSTRITGLASQDSASVTAWNPASVSIEEARDKINKKNEEQIRNGRKPYNVDENAFTVEKTIAGEKQHFNYINPDLIMPLGAMEDAVNEISMLEIKLRFLDFIIRQKEQYLDYQIDCKKHVA